MLRRAGVPRCQGVSRRPAVPRAGVTALIAASCLLLASPTGVFVSVPSTRVSGSRQTQERESATRVAVRADEWLSPPRHEQVRWSVLVPALLVGVALRALPAHAEAPQVPETPDEAIAPWLAVAPYYGTVLYLIGLGVQQFAFDSFNIAYVVCAVLFFGPALGLYVQWQYLGGGA
mmetsp:Transcript_28630/g.65982  ORF Transcript_28630/g.65982 Transcript_28630/m.65982 type:complete len:175 (+) Transcript_28630:59-583(+)